MTQEPEKPIDLLWTIDEILIALQRLRERIRRMAEHDLEPRRHPESHRDDSMTNSHRIATQLSSVWT